MPRKTLSIVLFALAARLPAHAGDDVSTVTVSARKEPVVRKLDRTVHDVAGTPRAANGSAQDVLQSIPEVSVTADGRIAVKGNQQVTVLVDGKPAAMLSGSGEERAVALQTMSGADIASVEVVTNPSAAYAANGGAVLNIVLKRNRKPGAHAQLQGSAARQGLWNAGASGDFTRGRVSLHGNLALRRDGTLKVRGSQIDWNDAAGGPAGQAAQASRVFVRRAVQSAALGLDVALNDMQTLSLSGRTNSRRSRPLFDVLNEERTGSDDTVYHRISEGPNEQADRSASLAYNRQDRGTVLKATLQHGATGTVVDKSYRDVFVLPARATTYSHGATRSARRLDQATLDWTHAMAPGTLHGQWGMGLDLQRQVDGMDNLQASVDPALGTEIPDPRTTNAYAVRTTLAAAYLTDRIEYGRWEALLGGRAERMALRVDPVQGAAGTSRWQAFNPSLHLKRHLGEASGLTLNYRRSLQRPDPRDLNPFATYVDARNLGRGNPGLRPQRVGAWEIGAETEKGHVSGSLGAFRRTSRDTVVDAYTVDSAVDGGVLVASKRNGGLARSTGVTASLAWTPATALRLDADAGAYRVTLATPGIGGVVRQDGVSNYVNVKAAYRAGPDDVSLDAHRQSGGIAPLGRYGATSSVNLSWKRRLSATSSLTVNASDLFDGSRRTVETGTGAFRHAGFEHFVGRRIYVGFVRKIE